MFPRHCPICLNALVIATGDAAPRSCWSSRQLAPGFPTASVRGAETGSTARSALWSWRRNHSPSATFGDPGMAGEMPSHGSLSCYASWQCLGEGGPSSPIRSGREGNTVGHVVADNAWGCTVLSSVLVFLLRYSFLGSSSAPLPGHRTFPVAGCGPGVNTSGSALILPTRELSKAQLDL